MLITLLTLAIASLAATPLVAPAVRRFTETRKQIKKEGTQALKEKKTSANQSEIKDLPKADQSDRQHHSAPQKNIVPEFSLELVKSSKTTSSSTNSSTPLVEVVWKTSSGVSQSVSSTHQIKPQAVQSVQIKSESKKDLVEDMRSTPSADRLFEDFHQPQEQTHSTFESVNPQDPPRLIRPKAIASIPKAAQQLSSPNFASASTQNDSEDAIEPQALVKRYQVGAEKFKMNPVQSSESSKSSRPTAIPMMLTTTPSAVSSKQHFEVIQPQTPMSSPSFSLLEQPEHMARGEQAWLGFQPLYINFSPFFSLDSLMDLSSKKMKTHLQAKGKTSSISSSQNLKQQHKQQQLNLLRDLNSERERFMQAQEPSLGPKQYHEEIMYHDFDESDDEGTWAEAEALTQDEAPEKLPEWHSLLGLSNHFLYDMKLKQGRSNQHRVLAEERLEDALVFNITSSSGGSKIQTSMNPKG